MPTRPRTTRPTPSFPVVPGHDPGTHPTAGTGRTMGHRVKPGDDAGRVRPAPTQSVVPAKAGTSTRRHLESIEIPAFAGMTDTGKGTNPCR